MKTLTRSILALLALPVIMLVIWLMAIQPEQEARVQAEADARLNKMQARLSEIQAAKKDAEIQRFADEKIKAAEDRTKAAENQLLAEQQTTQKKLDDIEEQLREEKAGRATDLQGPGVGIQPNNPFFPRPAAPEPSVIGVLKDSAGKDNGAISSGVTFVPGLVGQAMQFNGQDSQIDFGPTAGNVGASDFTIDWWMNTSSAPPGGIQSFLAKRADCDAVSCLDITVGGGMPVGPGRLQLGLRDDVNGNAFYTKTALNDGKWHHVAWERQADPGGTTATEKVFVDGQLNNTTTDDLVLKVSTLARLVMGTDCCVGRNGTVPYRGSADALEIWNRALTAEEIAGNYQAGLAGKHPGGNGLVNSWFSQSAALISTKVLPEAQNPLTVQTSIGAVADSTGKDHGAISGGVTFAPGKLGQAFHFNGQDSQIDLGPTAANFGTKDFTLDYWMNAPNNTNPRGEAFLDNRLVCGICSCLTISVGRGEPGAQGMLVFGMLDDRAPGGSGLSQLISNFRANDGLWHHIAWERRTDPGQNTCSLLLYVDGELRDTAANQPVSFVSTPGHLLMGQSVCVGNDGTTPYSGAADGLEIWNRALTAAEIKENYQAGLAGKHPAGNGLLNSWWGAKAAVNPWTPPMAPINIIRGPGPRIRPGIPRPAAPPNQINPIL